MEFVCCYRIRFGRCELFQGGGCEVLEGRVNLYPAGLRLSNLKCINVRILLSIRSRAYCMASAGTIIATGKCERISTEGVHSIAASCKGEETLALVQEWNMAISNMWRG
jgi:hypothetical protein